MVKRTRAQSITDDLAFPVRIKIAVPGDGLGRTLDRMFAWLAEELQPRDYARHSQPGMGCNTSAFYFRTAEAAQRFVAAFPDVQLADGTRSPGFYSPNR